FMAVCYDGIIHEAKMFTPDQTSPSLTLPSVSSVDTWLARRLIVLVPGVEIDQALVIHRVWELDHTLECSVLFLGLCRDVLEEPGLRRALITMSALLHDDWIAAEMKTEIGNNW